MLRLRCRSMPKHIYEYPADRYRVIVVMALLAQRSVFVAGFSGQGQASHLDFREHNYE